MKKGSKDSGGKRTTTRPRRQQKEPRFRYEQFRALVAIVESKNLKEAAAQLGCTTATLQNLTNGLGDNIQQILGTSKRLYEYQAETRCIQATEFGEQLYQRVRSAVADIEGLPAEIARIDAGEHTLRICAPETLLECGLFDEIGAVAETEPVPKVDVLNRGSQGALSMLLAHRCQIAFVSAYTVARTHLTHRYVPREYRAMPIHLYVRARDRRSCERGLRQYRGAKGADNTREALAWILANHRLILPGDWSAFRQYINDFFAQHGLVLGPDSVSEFDSNRVKFEAVRHGMGAALSWADDSLLGPEVIARVSLEGIVPAWRYLAVYHEGRLSEAGKAFIEKACGPLEKQARRGRRRGRRSAPDR